MEIADDLKAELYETFKIFDMDLNGFIDISEIERLLDSLHIKYSRYAIVKNVKKVDVDGNGYMDFNEFCVFMAKSKPDEKYSELRNIFRLVDTDGNGEIDRQELRTLLVNVGRMTLTDEDLDDMFSVIDHRRVGVIKFEDFASFFKDLV